MVNSSIGMAGANPPGSLGASAWVVANDAPAAIKNFGTLLSDAGFPASVCDATADDVQIQARIDGLPA